MYTNDDIDDDSFCRVHARPQLTYRLPHGCTSSSISSDSAPYPQYDCSYDDDDDYDLLEAKRMDCLGYGDSANRNSSSDVYDYNDGEVVITEDTHGEV